MTLSRLHLVCIQETGIVGGVPTKRSRGHDPRLVQRPDGRWEVRCPQCEKSRDEAIPLGIAVPIANRVEAEAIMRNHGRGVGES